MYITKLQNQRKINLSNYETINQTCAASCVSERYKFISTSQVLAVLADHGWQPVKVVESSTRIIEKQGFQKHAITLANDRFSTGIDVGGTLPRLVLTNSHSGCSSFAFHIALMELVCSNGLMVSTGDQSFRVTHNNYADLAVEQTLSYILNGLIQALKDAEKYRSIVLTEFERQRFAKEAINMRWDGEKYSVDTDHVLRARRHSQNDKTLWNTFNVVQESIIKGGIWQKGKNNKITRSRPIRGIDQSIKLNKKLWLAMETLAEKKG